jgi:DNA-binding beta-propeller fold protein YncE
MPGHPESAAYDPGTGEVLVTSTVELDDVSVISDTLGAVVATVPVGNGPGDLAFDTVSGRAYVTNYLQGTVSLLFIARTYLVPFTESGLPAGALWYLNVTANAPVNSTGSLVELNLTNGTYQYFVSPANKTFEGAVEGVTFVVNGAGPALAATFVKTTYRVTITETGLASGALWFATVDSNQQYSHLSTIIFPEPNGTHYFRVTSVAGYASSHDTGSFGVYGAPAVVFVSFAPLTDLPGPFTFEPVDYVLLAMDVLVVVVGSYAVLNLRRRSREPPEGTAYEESPFPTPGPETPAGAAPDEPR